MWALEELVRKGLSRAGVSGRDLRRGTGAAGRRAGFICVLALTALAVAGCTEPGLDNAYTTYLKRLGNTLDVTPEAIATTAAPRYPRSGKLQLELPGSSVDTLDFLALTGCAVQVTIGKRNSSLGLLARPSQRLLLELEYLRQAPACVEHLNNSGKATLAETLQQAWHQKRAQLPALIFNATLASEEFRALWRANPVPGAYPPVQSSQVIAALGAVNHHVSRWLGGDYQADNTEFELLLSDIAGGDGGVVLQALARQQDWLAEADRLLATQQERGPLCASGLRRDAADILPTVARKFFVGEIQPQAVQMERRIYALLPPLETLENTLAPTLPAAYRQWRDARDSLLTQVRAAPARHVAAIQQSLEGCG